MNHEHKRGSFSGKIGFVLAAAGASVGLGNILALSLSCRKIRRRNFSAYIHYPCNDFRIYHDRCRDVYRTYDGKKSGRSI